MKLLIIAPHLSTGGLPQYTLAQVQRQKPHFEIFLIEYAFHSPEYIVQRKKIQELLDPDHFISLNGNKADLPILIRKIDPDVVHWEEIPEMFCDRSIADAIYTKRDRAYSLVETTHTSQFNVKDKNYLPDRFMLVSPWSMEQYRPLGVELALVEYPVIPHKRPARAKAVKSVNLDPKICHVLNVGLFTPGKNQGEAFEMAAEMIKMPIQFHFIGNQAPNFKDYWEKLTRPRNCVVWGERDDVENWYAACDLLLFNSKLELNPIVLKEALSWNIPILMRDLPTYCGAYKEGENLRFLGNDTKKNVKTLTEMLAL